MTLELASEAEVHNSILCLPHVFCLIFACPTNEKYFFSLISDIFRFATPSNLHSTPLPSTPQLSFGATPVRDEVIGGHALGSCQDVSNNWVTVFGFPPSAASFILSQFSQLGTILQHHIPPNGNWMHLKYQTKLVCFVLRCSIPRCDLFFLHQDAGSKGVGQEQQSNGRKHHDRSELVLGPCGNDR